MIHKEDHSYKVHKQAKVTIYFIYAHRGGKTIKESKEVILQKSK